MPSQSIVSKSAWDPVNLLVIAAAIAITFLPFTMIMVIQKSTEASMRVRCSPKPCGDGITRRPGIKSDGRALKLIQHGVPPKSAVA